MNTYFLRNSPYLVPFYVIGAILFFVFGLPLTGSAWLGAGVIFAGGYAHAKHKSVGLAKEAAALEERNRVHHDPEFGVYNGYVCPTWETNRIERELGGTDLMLCDNEECTGCYPHGKCAVGDCNERGYHSWRSGYHNTNIEYLCTNCYTVRDEDRKRTKAVMEKKKAKELEAKAQFEEAKVKAAAERKARVEAKYAELAAQGLSRRNCFAAGCKNGSWSKSVSKYYYCPTHEAEQRWTDVEGIRVKRPHSVPDYAHGSWTSDGSQMGSYVHWTWTDASTGYPMGRRSSHPEAWDLEASYEILDGAGNRLMAYGDTNKESREYLEMLKYTGQVLKHGDTNEPRNKTRPRPNPIRMEKRRY